MFEQMVSTTRQYNNKYGFDQELSDFFSAVFNHIGIDPT